MHGSRRVIVFCILTTVLPSLLIILPLYLRNSKYADVMYKISDSDVIQIHKGQSSIFCEKHSLKMNVSFNAFQMKGKPVLSDKRKHIRLRKSMTLPDDTLEYWGFYLFKGATVELKTCSRYLGSKVLVVKGDKTLNTCGILDKNRKDPPLIVNQGHVLVTVETPLNLTKLMNNANDEDLLIEETKIVQDGIQSSKDTVKSSSLKISKNIKKRDLGEKSPSLLHNPNTVLDAGVHHGGNAFISTPDTLKDESVSSFENSLHDCYNGNILINELVPFSIQCNSTSYSSKTVTLKVVHEVLSDGYYYYIFYSDNDIVQNDIHVLFDIYKPTFQYLNSSSSKVCIDQTECEFDVSVFSDELVIVEVPTRDGITNGEADSSILISVCHPRTTVYVFFPVCVLILILLFAFL